MTQATAPRTIQAITSPGHPFTLLHRKARNTMGARFQAARRLAIHAKLSQWMPALLSIALIVISVMQALALLSHVDGRVISAIEVGASTLLLVFSLLLGLENYAVRADKSHRCGMELAHLVRKLEAYSGECGIDAGAYEHLNAEYFQILSQYENHEHCDYLRYMLQYRTENYPSLWKQYVPTLMRAYTGYLASFWPYAILLGLSGITTRLLLPK